MNQSTPESITKSKARFSGKILTFIKKHKIIVISLVVVIALAFATEAIITNIQVNKIMSFLEGKNFITESTQGATRLISFQDGKVSTELWTSTFGQEGDINNLMDCRVIKSGPFSDNFAIQANYGDYWSTVELVVLCDDNTVLNYTYSSSDPVWREITKEELDKEHATRFCGEHKFSEWVSVVAATCAKSGSESRTCEQCGYQETQSVYVEHNFVNSVCSMCGAEKQPEKSDIEPDTWYVCEDVLYTQNCLVISATSVSQGRGMTVHYKAVCRHCHTVDESSKLAGPEVGYPVEKIYTCEYCDGKTMIKFKIDQD